MDNDSNNWFDLASEIENAVNKSCRQFESLPDKVIEWRSKSGEWSIKEIVGHLVDSASNNHQRFVRLQVADGLHFPDYSQDNDAWVSIQTYQEAPWKELLALWRFFNFQLARIIRTVNTDCLDHIWVVDENTSVTLRELMVDYLRHLRDHLRHIRELIDRRT
jgi:hypothetical protein